MVAVPEPAHSTVRSIYEWYESKKEAHREHLGASLIGHDCDRYLWLTFRWAASPQFEGRLLRLFETGKLEEARIHDNLRGIGVELITEEDGKQIDCRDDYGHFGGSVDGVARGFPEAPKTWAVLEIKTMNNKAFDSLTNKGVKVEKPQHYAQMQSYMGLMKLDRAMYVAVNKNTDELYSEWVRFDKPAFDSLAHRVKRIVGASTPQQRISEDPSHWKCKMCDMYKLCHQAELAEVNCRTCCHSTAVEDGKWSCDVHQKLLTASEQLKGCGDHLMIPALVPNAEAVDGGMNSIDYVDKLTGATFTNGPGHTPSDQLAQVRQAPAIKGRARSAPFIRKRVPLINGVPFDDEIPF
tara:strand:+ start:74 stop:1129 length:1056 start_codon:yes stop_codon:yes gene_type:complete